MCKYFHLVEKSLGASEIVSDVWATKWKSNLPPGKTGIFIEFAVKQCEIKNRIQFKINQINNRQTPKSWTLKETLITNDLAARVQIICYRILWLIVGYNLKHLYKFQIFLYRKQIILKTLKSSIDRMEDVETDNRS